MNNLKSKFGLFFRYAFDSIRRYLRSLLIWYHWWLLSPRLFSVYSSASGTEINTQCYVVALLVEQVCLPPRKFSEPNRASGVWHPFLVLFCFVFPSPSPRLASETKTQSAEKKSTVIIWMSQSNSNIISTLPYEPIRFRVLKFPPYKCQFGAIMDFIADTAEIDRGKLPYLVIFSLRLIFWYTFL